MELLDRFLIAAVGGGGGGGDSVVEADAAGWSKTSRSWVLILLSYVLRLFCRFNER